MRRDSIDILILLTLSFIAACLVWLIITIANVQTYIVPPVPQCRPETEIQAPSWPSTPPHERYADPEEVRELVRRSFSDAPIMVQVARCESTFRHYLSDGSVLQGRVDPDDTGVMQINKRYHEPAAERMGLDLENIHDNLAFARHLYETQGTQPWYASAGCWSDHLSYHR